MLIYNNKTLWSLPQFAFAILAIFEIDYPLEDLLRLPFFGPSVDNKLKERRRKKNHFIAFTSNINVNQVINRSTRLRVASELILIEFLWQKICKVRKNKTYQLISTLLVAQAEDHWIECAARTIIICFAYRLNMPHDDDKRCEKFRGNATHKQNIMSRMLDHNTHPWSWSNCSRFHATEFIEWVFSSST